MGRSTDQDGGEGMGPQQARDIKNGAIGEIAQAFTNPVRLELLGILAQGEASVDILAAKTGQSKANVSAHLKVLLAARLVAVRRQGRHAFYRLASPAVRRLYGQLQDVAFQIHPELRELLQTWLERPERLDRAGAQELLVRARRGEVVLVDVRPEDEHAAGHLPGAVSIPAEHLEARIRELPEGEEIVVYCRGRYCVLAAESIRRLRAHGRRATNLYASVAEWAEHGLPVEGG